MQRARDGKGHGAPMLPAGAPLSTCSPSESYPGVSEVGALVFNSTSRPAPLPPVVQGVGLKCPML